MSFMLVLQVYMTNCISDVDHGDSIIKLSRYIYHCENRMNTFLEVKSLQP